MTCNAHASCLVSLLWLAACATMAHDGAHPALARLGQRIAEDPTRAELYLSRAEVYWAHGQWREAERDAQRAVALAPGSAPAHLALARLYAENDRTDEALAAAAEAIRLAPNEPRGHLVRARALRGAGRAEEAVLAYSAAVEGAHEPDLLPYLERAETILEHDSDGVLQALASLDAGVKDLGDIPALHRAAIPLELRLGRVDSALARLDRLISRAPMAGKWLIERGRILAEAGRARAAADAYRDALKEIAGVPPHRQRAPGIAALAKQARDGLAELADDEGAP